MSTVAVKKNKNSIELSWDSQMSSGERKYLDYRGAKKVFSTKDFVYAHTGWTRIASILEAFVKKSDPSQDIYNWWLNFQEHLNSFNLEIDEDNDELLLLDKKKLKIYWISGKGIITEIKQYTAIGTGESYAMSALYLGHSTKEAVEAASKFDLRTGGDISSLKL